MWQSNKASNLVYVDKQEHGLGTVKRTLLGDVG